MTLNIYSYIIKFYLYVGPGAACTLPVVKRNATPELRLVIRNIRGYSHNKSKLSVQLR